MKPVLIIAVTTLLVGCGNLIKSGALVEAQNSLNGKNHSDALESTAIAEFFGELSEEDTARLHFIRAESFEGLGRLQDAIPRYQYVIDHHGSSAYSGAARQRLEILSAPLQNIPSE